MERETCNGLPFKGVGVSMNLFLYHVENLAPLNGTGLYLLLNNDQARRRKHKLKLINGTFCEATGVGLYHLLGSTQFKQGETLVSNVELPTKDKSFKLVKVLKKGSKRDYLNKHKGNAKSLINQALLRHLESANAAN
jgi:hypothetical protein